MLSGATTQASGSPRWPQVIWGGGIAEVKLNKGTATDNFDRLADIEAR